MKFITLKESPEEGVSHNPEIAKQVLLRRGEVPHLTNFARSRIAPGQSVTAHRHVDMHEVFYVESGAGRIKVNEQEHSLSAGACVAVAPTEAHEIMNTGTEELVLLYFGIES